MRASSAAAVHVTHTAFRELLLPDLSDPALEQQRARRYAPVVAREAGMVPWAGGMPLPPSSVLLAYRWWDRGDMAVLDALADRIAAGAPAAMPAGSLYAPPVFFCYGAMPAVYVVDVDAACADADVAGYLLVGRESGRTGDCAVGCAFGSFFRRDGGLRGVAQLLHTHYGTPSVDDILAEADSRRLYACDATFDDYMERRSRDVPPGGRFEPIADRYFRRSVPRREWPLAAG